MGSINKIGTEIIPAEKFLPIIKKPLYQITSLSFLKILQNIQI